MAIRRVMDAGYYESAEEGVSAFLGKERTERYKELFPLLALLCYRTKSETELVETMQRVCWGDMIVPYGRPFWKACLHVAASLYCVYICG